MAFNFEFPYTDPNFYNDDWILNKMKELLSFMESMEVWKTEYEEAYEDYKKMLEDIENGTFPESIQKAFYNWMSEHAIDLVGKLVNLVIFNITDDGYFVAYIPQSWDEITFGTTGLDENIPLQPEYGHLVLSYEASTSAY